MDELGDDNKTIFTSPSDLDSDERAAVKTGEARGKREAIKEDSKRFGLAGQRGKNLRKYETGYVKAFGHE